MLFALFHFIIFNDIISLEFIFAVLVLNICPKFSKLKQRLTISKRNTLESAQNYNREQVLTFLLFECCIMSIIFIKMTTVPDLYSVAHKSIPTLHYLSEKQQIWMGKENSSGIFQNRRPFATKFLKKYPFSQKAKVSGTLKGYITKPIWKSKNNVRKEGSNFLKKKTKIKLKWCDYLKYIGASAAKKCRNRNKSAIKKYLGNGKIKKTISTFEQCSGYYGRCTSSHSCESGIACFQKATTNPCCRPSNIAHCPVVDYMGYECRKNNPVNWCNSDIDCGNNRKKQICCPTGCGYNTCIHNISKKSATTSLKGIDTSLEKDAINCPHPVLIPVNCNIPRPTSWCTSENDCVENHGQANLHCCKTLCDYSICLARFPDRWLIT